MTKAKKAGANAKAARDTWKADADAMMADADAGTGSQGSDELAGGSEAPAQSPSAKLQAKRAARSGRALRMSKALDRLTDDRLTVDEDEALNLQEMLQKLRDAGLSAIADRVSEGLTHAHQDASAYLQPQIDNLQAMIAADRLKFLGMCTDLAKKSAGTNWNELSELAREALVTDCAAQWDVSYEEASAVAKAVASNVPIVPVRDLGMGHDLKGRGIEAFSKPSGSDAVEQLLSIVAWVHGAMLKLRSSRQGQNSEAVQVDLVATNFQGEAQRWWNALLGPSVFGLSGVDARGTRPTTFAALTQGMIPRWVGEDAFRLVHVQLTQKCSLPKMGNDYPAYRNRFMELVYAMRCLCGQGGALGYEAPPEGTLVLYFVVGLGHEEYTEQVYIDPKTDKGPTTLARAFELADKRHSHVLNKQHTLGAILTRTRPDCVGNAASYGMKHKRVREELERLVRGGIRKPVGKANGAKGARGGGKGGKSGVGAPGFRPKRDGPTRKRLAEERRCFNCMEPLNSGERPHASGLACPYAWRASQTEPLVPKGN